MVYKIGETAKYIIGSMYQARCGLCGGCERAAGTVKEKIEALEGAGVVVAESLGDVAVKIKGMI